MTKAEIKRNKRIVKLLVEIDKFLAEVTVAETKRHWRRMRNYA